eukprot:TRINITY_DN47387_c0_g1_i1.p1 TRINITY_DN47387_c0_g1~~TRINITY_DN47387_c0_g1_i1.p1  ORF type:complete len:120 (+),score=15.05 TRINITY_DN47387_c0_g1_i1:178-537(+)
MCIRDRILCGLAAAWSTPVCDETLQIVVAAQSGWLPRWHHIFPDHFREGVVVVLLVAQRLSALSERPRPRTIPHLSKELWLRIIGHLPWDWSWKWDWAWADHLMDDFTMVLSSSESDND